MLDHRKKDNPYESRFGAEWREKIRKMLALSKYVSINEMVKHMHDETEKAFKGTTHESDWMFYHDALSLMTCKETHAWMEREGYL